MSIFIHNIKTLETHPKILQIVYMATLSKNILDLRLHNDVIDNSPEKMIARYKTEFESKIPCSFYQQHEKEACIAANVPLVQFEEVSLQNTEALQQRNLKNSTTQLDEFHKCIRKEHLTISANLHTIIHAKDMFYPENLSTGPIILNAELMAKLDQKTIDFMNIINHQISHVLMPNRNILPNAIILNAAAMDVLDSKTKCLLDTVNNFDR